MPLHVLSTMFSSSGGQKLYYTVPGIITPIGGRPVHRFIISLFQASTCFEHHVLIIRRSKLYYTASGIVTPVGGRPATYRCDDNRRCKTVAYPGILFGGGGSTNSVEDRENGELGAVAP